MSLKRTSIKRVLNYLQVAYHSSIVGYPRVDNTYKKTNFGYDMFPHPEFPKGLSRVFNPLNKRKSLTVNVDDLVLFLSTLHIITPSQIESVIDYLEYYLDEDLNPKSISLSEEIKTVIRTLDLFLEENNLDRKKLNKMKQELSLNTAALNEESFLFAQQSIFFFDDNEDTRAKCQTWKKMINNRPNSDTLEHGGIIQMNSLQECFIAYDTQMKAINTKEKRTSEVSIDTFTINKGVTRNG